MCVHPQNTSTMQARSWLFPPTQNLQDGTGLGSVTVPAYHPSLCLLFFTLICALCWGGAGRRKCCPDLPGSIALLLLVGFGQGEVPADQEAGGERWRVFLPWSPPCRFMVWLHHPCLHGPPKAGSLFYFFH